MIWINLLNIILSKNQSQSQTKFLKVTEEYIHYGIIHIKFKNLQSIIFRDTYNILEMKCMRVINTKVKVEITWGRGQGDAWGNGPQGPL